MTDWPERSFPRSAAANGLLTRDPPAGPYDAVGYLTVFLFLLMFVPSSFIAPLGGIATPAILWALVTLLLYLTSWIAGGPIPSGHGRPVRLAVLFFSLAALASFVAGMTRNILPEEVLSSERGLIGIAAWAGVIIVVSEFVTSYERLDTLLRRTVVFGSVVAAIGIFEFYSGINVVNYIHIPGMSGSFNQNTLWVRSNFNRPSSTAMNPIEFGLVMAMLLPFALQQALDRARQGAWRRWVPVALIGFAIPVTLSRSGILAVAISLILLVPTWKARQVLAFLVIFPIAVFVGWVTTPGLIGTLRGLFNSWLGGSDSSVISRNIAFSQDWKYVAERPIFGRGFGTFLPQIYSYTDNMYLQILVCTGVVGLVAFIGLYVSAIYCGALGRHLANGEARRGQGQAIVSSLFAAAVGSATFDSFAFPIYAGMTVLLIGVAGAYYGIMRAESKLAAR